MFKVHTVTKSHWRAKGKVLTSHLCQLSELTKIDVIFVFRDLTSLDLSMVPQMFHSRYETNNCCKKWMSKIFLDVDILMLTRNMKLLHVNISILHELWRVQCCFIRKSCCIISISCDAICAIPCDVYSIILWCMCNIVWYMLFGILKSIVTYILLCVFENIVVFVQ